MRRSICLPLIPYTTLRSVEIVSSPAPAINNQFHYVFEEQDLLLMYSYSGTSSLVAAGVVSNLELSSRDTVQWLKFSAYIVNNNHFMKPGSQD